jgi:hypothetical protein
MTNSDSYAMMEALRKYLKLKVYETSNTLEVVLQFKTEDGKLHQLCSSSTQIKLPALLKPYPDAA